MPVLYHSLFLEDRSMIFHAVLIPNLTATVQYQYEDMENKKKRLAPLSGVRGFKFVRVFA